VSLEIKGIFIPPDQQTDLILLEKKKRGHVKEGPALNAIP
jgi:hypothetical protein